MSHVLALTALDHERKASSLLLELNVQDSWISVPPTGFFGALSSPEPTTDFSGTKGKLGAHAMKRVAAGAHLLTPFSPLRNAQAIQPTTAWAAVSSPSGSTGYSFLHLSGVGHALWANRANVLLPKRTPVDRTSVDDPRSCPENGRAGNVGTGLSGHQSHHGPVFSPYDGVIC